MPHHVEGVEVLFAALENALKHHCAVDSDWWQRTERSLRTSRWLVIRYLHLIACLENIPANLAAIAEVLIDEKLFRSACLNYELGELMNRSYPHLSESVWERNQRLLLELAGARRTGEAGGRAERSRWAVFLAWIPAMCRMPETELVLARVGPMRMALAREHEVIMSGGLVRSPVGAQQLLQLPLEGLIELLRHYDGSARIDDNHFDLIGGAESVAGELREAVSMHPRRYLSIVPRLRWELRWRNWVDAVLEGVAHHLRLRAGKLRSSTPWKPVELPACDLLCRDLLGLIELWPSFWKGTLELSRALLACAEAPLEPSLVGRWCFVAAFGVHSHDPSDDRTLGREDVLGIGINSARGVLAQAALTITNHLLETGERLAPELLCIVRQLACDPNPAVRAVVLHELPFAMDRAPALGWSLLEDLVGDSDTRLWELAERTLYYQYYSNYTEVRRWLIRMASDGGPGANEAWGRLNALCCLSRLLEMEALIGMLKDQGSVEAWKGAAEVFAVNLDSSDLDARGRCLSGLVTVLREVAHEAVITQVISGVFVSDERRRHVSHELALAILAACATCGNVDLFGFCAWLADAAEDHPSKALEVFEALMNAARSRGTWILRRDDDLLRAFTVILREADESNDMSLIRRVIRVQDDLLKLDVANMDALFDAAGRS